MPKRVLAGVLFVHGMIGNRLWDVAAGVFVPMSTRSMETLLVRGICDYSGAEGRCSGGPSTGGTDTVAAECQFLRDGEPYQSYPSDRPELSELKNHSRTTHSVGMASHLMPSTAYIVAGELTLERKRDGKKQHLQPDRQSPKPWTHSIEAWQEVNRLC